MGWQNCIPSIIEYVKIPILQEGQECMVSPIIYFQFSTTFKQIDNQWQPHMQTDNHLVCGTEKKTQGRQVTHILTNENPMFV